jgi:proteasome lid subunit RPN8/RPN11
MITEWLRKFRKQKRQRITTSYACHRRIIITSACVRGIQDCLSPNIKKKHEGVCYLLGKTDGFISLAVSAIRPKAKTTSGSFFVDKPAMALIVRAAANHSLQVIGQVHTHPRLAFHSDGDNQGANITYNGYVSIVLPDYGKRLPSFDGAALFMYQNRIGFIELRSSNFIIIPEVLP